MLLQMADATVRPADLLPIVEISLRLDHLPMTIPVTILLLYLRASMGVFGSI